jgi:hypothetical protein
MFNNDIWECELDSSVSGQGPEVICYEHDSKLSDFVKGDEFLD